MAHDWQNWIDRLKSRDLTQEELREFEDALREDPALADEYLDALLTDTSLEAEGLPDPRAWMRSMVASPLSSPIPRRAYYRSPGFWAAAAAVVLIMGAAGFFTGRSSVHPKVAMTPGKPEPVATITDADDAAAAVGLKIGAPLDKGTLVIPDQSKVGIAMRSGARLEIRGPANLELENSERIRLDKGRLSTYAPEYAHGFTVVTNDGRVVDLGTRFITSAGTKLGTEVHVLDGLVETYSSPFRNDLKPQDLKKTEAAILKDGKMTSTDYLARRFDVPLDPNLPDSDGDGIPDATEVQYGSDPYDSASQPVLLRMEESFRNYPIGPIARVKATTVGVEPAALWEGGGSFVSKGLTYENHGRTLITSNGSVRTLGEANVGSTLFPLTRLPANGVFYISYLMQIEQPATSPKSTFGGFLLYNGDKEELFVGDLSTGGNMGSRFRTSVSEEHGKIPVDGATHLFVIRIDRTKLVTDIYVDPPLGEPENAGNRFIRYQDVPVFDRISMRSASSGAQYPVNFDEIRIGLTWDSVLPLEK
ncbi:FecR domain-containing protein [Luteolibacter ambystomatis]|uniref:FecR domain-containing protein n=1 Tax=Luteolibacter ambystomatis TaxID=2824561 RepID=A0A975G5U7_9BACT|nr:FecR domain-containing protein [Luteolibacter ambystomatis]QUE49343.1 FecR domain-containing protein [Luteolibacter ambystomatis]